MGRKEKRRGGKVEEKKGEVKGKAKKWDFKALSWRRRKKVVENEEEKKKERKRRRK